MKNNNKIVIILCIIIVILLVLCTLFATGTISLSNSNESNINQEEGNKEVDTNNIENDVTTNDKWTNYLLSRHILEAKLTRTRSKDLGDSENINKTVTLTDDDIKEILSKLEDRKLSKTWSEGRGGPERDYLSIAYEYNGQEYAFEIYYGDISVNKLDDDFKNILENNKYEEKNIEYKDIQGAFYFYDIENFNESIFDKYFN